MPPANDRRILHFTDVANVPKIIAAGGIWPDNVMTNQSYAFRDCASADIKEARRTKPVPMPPYGCVGDYVPFYYAPRSPMMSAISKGGVPGYSDSRQLVYFASTVGAVCAAGLGWVCTDGNARTGLTRFFGTLEELESKIDWSIMEERYWANTADDGDRKRRRMAEFLVHGFFPIGLVTGIATHNQGIMDSIEGFLPPHIFTAVKPELYI
ncbi:DUF4433 domain-containing protein [Lentzea albidocapillata]|uniref:type II toxin-antitoxin system toxin DNA ADP-ribosyl transferase DarT n=1 Tax=Lentzea albidocapillata TaxID=40571 RepID=UPI0013563D88|nr:DUF4433 domain-containing protein [Lentzea albidocapillata]